MHNGHSRQAASVYFDDQNGPRVQPNPTLVAMHPGRPGPGAARSFFVPVRSIHRSSYTAPVWGQPPAVLSSLGVPVVHALCGVGEKLRDHCYLPVTARVKFADSINERSRGLRLAREILRYVLERDGILALPPTLVYVSWRCDEMVDSDDVQTRREVKASHGRIRFRDPLNLSQSGRPTHLPAAPLAANCGPTEGPGSAQPIAPDRTFAEPAPTPGDGPQPVSRRDCRIESKRHLYRRQARLPNLMVGQSRPDNGRGGTVR